MGFWKGLGGVVASCNLDDSSTFPIHRAGREAGGEATSGGTMCGEVMNKGVMKCGEPVRLEGSGPGGARSRG
jgi:hypothetical protein